MPYLYTVAKNTEIRLKIPCDALKGWGEYPKRDAGYTQGFKVEDTDAGTITKDTDSDEATGCNVIYKHLKDTSPNTVTFTAADGRVEHIYFVPQGIHDHSSIGQGGPAFGTYATLIEEEP